MRRSHVNVYPESSLIGVPNIPLSELTRSSVKFKALLQVARGEVDRAEKKNLQAFRRCIESLRIHEFKLEQVTNEMAEISGQSILTWSPERLALTLTTIDANLFVIEPRYDFKCRRSSTSPSTLYVSKSIKACLDFNRFVERIIIDQIVSSSKFVSTHPPHVVRAQALKFVIETAFILYYVYRNLSSALTLLKVLKSAEVVRLKTSWNCVNKPTTDILNHLISVLPSPYSTSSYSDHSSLVDQILSHHSIRSGILAVIPFLPPIVDEMLRIQTAYSTSSPSSASLLSDIGMKVYEDAVSLIEACQGNFRRDTPTINKRPTTGSVNTLWDVRKRPLPSPPEDLFTMKKDLKMEHWLLTRVFWSRHDLFGKSTEAEVFNHQMEVYPELNEERIELFQEMIPLQERLDLPISTSHKHPTKEQKEEIEFHLDELEMFEEYSAADMASRDGSDRGKSL